MNGSSWKTFTFLSFSAAGTLQNKTPCERMHKNLITSDLFCDFGSNTESFSLVKSPQPFYFFALYWHFAGAGKTSGFKWKVAVSIPLRSSTCFLFFFSGTGQNLHRALKIEKIKHWQMAVTFYTGHVVPCHLTWQPSQKRNRGEITAAVSHFLSPLSAPLAPRHAFAPSIGSTWGESAVLVIMFNLFPTVSPVFLSWIIKAAWSRLLHTSSARAKPSEGTNMRADEEKQQ